MRRGRRNWVNDNNDRECTLRGPSGQKHCCYSTGKFGKEWIFPSSHSKSSWCGQIAAQQCAHGSTEWRYPRSRSARVLITTFRPRGRHLGHRRCSSSPCQCLMSQFPNPEQSLREAVKKTGILWSGWPWGLTPPPLMVKVCDFFSQIDWHILTYFTFL